MEAKLIVLTGKQKDREIPLPETIFLIGRDPQCHLRPHCQLVSKLHCAIAAWAGMVKVRDLKSSNGTFLNGKPIVGEVTVAHGDQLQVGTLTFAFLITNPTGSPLPAPVDRGEMQWLLDSPSDSTILKADAGTRIVRIEDAVAADRKLINPGVSAGQHLRDYFNRGKKHPNPAAPRTN